MTGKYTNNQDLRVAIGVNATWSAYVDAGNVWRRKGEAMVLRLPLNTVAEHITITIPYDPDTFNEVES